MKRWALSKKEKKSLALGIEIEKKDVVEIEEREEGKILYINGKPMFFWEDRWVPLLFPILEGKIKLPRVVVDKGAIKFVSNGADVMRPGIRQMDDFEKGEVVAIVEERHGKALAIGKALFSSEEIKKMEKGKVIKNLHHVGDKLWKLSH